MTNIKVLYDVITSKNDYSIYFNEDNDTLNYFNHKTYEKKIVNNDDAITLINQFNNIKTIVVFDYFIENSFDEIQQRYINKELTTKKELMLYKQTMFYKSL